LIDRVLMLRHLVTVAARFVHLFSVTGDPLEMSAAPASIWHRATPYMSWRQGHRFKTEVRNFLFTKSFFRDRFFGNNRGPWSRRFMVRIWSPRIAAGPDGGGKRLAADIGTRKETAGTDAGGFHPIENLTGLPPSAATD